MKFTIDTEKKIIYFSEPFNKDDIEYIFSVLKIKGLESWKISMEEPIITAPYTIPGTTNPYYIPGTNTPYITYCGTNTTDIDLTLGEYIYNSNNTLNG